MKLKNFYILSLIFLFGLFSCKKSNELPSNSINQLEVNGAVLPVHMHGDKNSDVAIIVVHGGPGESAILKREAVGFYRLEEKHLVVYYDQRASGISEGNVASESISIEQMVEDLDGVVELVDEISNASQFFIVSLDWGGAIAASYLASSDFNENIKGFIASSPGFNAIKNMSATQDTLQGIADSISIVAPEVVNNLQIFLNANPIINKFNYQDYYRGIDEILGIEFNSQYQNSEAELPAYIKRNVENNKKYVLENLTFEGEHFLSSLNVEPLLPLIPVPTKVIWGSHDLLFPVKLAQDYATQLGSPSDAELLSIFNLSAHRPYLEEGDRFYAVVSTWITLFD